MPDEFAGLGMVKGRKKAQMRAVYTQKKIIEGKGIAIPAKEEQYVQFGKFLIDEPFVDLSLLPAASFPPTTNFVANVTTGSAPLSVQFTDLSTESPTSWFWDFGDGSNSTTQNPIHMFTIGTYNISLTSTNSIGSDTGFVTNYISVLPISSLANFTANQTTGYAPLNVQFIDASVNATSWAWDFQNDGIVDNTTQNPVYTYVAEGNYTVNLTVMSVDNISSTMVKTDYISALLDIVYDVSVVSPVCEGLVYPNEKDLPSLAQIHVNFTVVVSPSFVNNSYVSYLQRASRIINLVCSETGNTTQKQFNCTAPMSYYYDAGGYDLHVNYTNYGIVTNSTSSDLCEYGQLLAMQKNNPVMTFADVGPNIPNIQSSVPLITENTGNVDFDVAMTGKDLTGRRNPGVKLLASSFKAGVSLGSAEQLSNNVSVNVVSLPASLNSNASVYLWLSMPLNTVPQDYYSQNAWQVSTS